jgi:hypothetical protein
VQFCLLLLVMQNSGCRPSTLYPTHHRPYSVYRNFSVVPRRVKGAAVGFDLRLSLDSFPRGEGTINANALKEVRLSLQSVAKNSNFLFDIASFIVAHGLRTGAFGKDFTLDHLYEDKRVTILGLRITRICLSFRQRTSGDMDS